MSCYTTILDAAREAAATAWPGLKSRMVTWDEESQDFGPAHITLVVVSEVDEDPAPIKVMTPNASGSLDVRFVQRALLNVDVRVECPDGNYDIRNNGIQPDKHFLRLVRQFRLAWGLAAVRAILADPIYPVKLTGKMGPIVNNSRDVAGITLPMCSFELQFRAMLGDISDPTTVGVINSVAATGTTDAAGDSVASSFQVTRP